MTMTAVMEAAPSTDPAVVSLPEQQKESLTLWVTPDDYAIEIRPAHVRILLFAHEWRHPGARFEHENILYRVPYLLEYKHYHPIRGKWWTSKAGFETAFLLYNHEIGVSLEKTYSYPVLVIGGQRIRTSTMGGGAGSWTDYIGTCISTCVGYSRKVLQSVAERAIPPHEAVKHMRGFEPNAKGVDARYYSHVAQYLCLRAIRDLLNGQKPVVIVGGSEYEVIKVVGKRRRLRLAGYTWCKYSQVDWLKTAAKLGIDVKKVVTDLTVPLTGKG